VIPLSGRMSGRASGPSRSCVNDAGGLQYVFWKIVRAHRVFPSRGLNRWKGDIRRWTRRSHPLVVRPRGGPHHHHVWPAPGPSPALLWTPSSCQVIRDFSFCFIQFREYFLCNFSETQKQQKTGNWHCGILLIGLFQKMHKNATKCKQNTKQMV
jgi:hypothetical protein